MKTDLPKLGITIKRSIKMPNIYQFIWLWGLKITTRPWSPWFFKIKENIQAVNQIWNILEVCWGTLLDPDPLRWEPMISDLNTAHAFVKSANLSLTASFWSLNPNSIWCLLLNNMHVSTYPTYNKQVQPWAFNPIEPNVSNFIYKSL